MKNSSYGFSIIYPLKHFSQVIDQKIKNVIGSGSIYIISGTSLEERDLYFKFRTFKQATLAKKKAINDLRLNIPYRSTNILGE